MAKIGKLRIMDSGKDIDELRDRFSRIPRDLDVVNIGSGPSFYDLDWNVVTGIQGYNLAVAPEDFRYDARIIMQYGEYLKQNGVVVVVVVCPLSFGRNDYLYKYAFSEKYALILPKHEVDLPGWRYDLCRACPALLKAKGIFQRLLSGATRRLYRLVTHTKPTDAITQTVKDWIAQNKYLNDLKDASQAEHYLDTFREKSCDLQAILANCRSQKLRPVIVLPPLSRELRGQISDEFVRRFVYDNLDKAVSDGTPVLDYIDDERFKEATYFTNGLFLTPQMRKVFTQIVWQDIQTLEAQRHGKEGLGDLND